MCVLATVPADREGGRGGEEGDHTVMFARDEMNDATTPPTFNKIYFSNLFKKFLSHEPPRHEYWKCGLFWKETADVESAGSIIDESLCDGLEW